MDLAGFNANDHASSAGEIGGGQILPAGRYKALIESTEEKPTKAGTGSYLELTFMVFEGEHRGSKIFARLNLNNQNDVAVRIAKKELAVICHAVGVYAPNDSSELHEKALLIDVVVEKRNDDPTKMTNRIKAYYQHDHQDAQPAAAPAGGGGGDKAPWQK